MKKIIIALLFLTTQMVVAQTISYNDAGVLFSTDKINGTARYNAMSGAFGALGGDISAIDINPAAGSVFLNSDFSLTLGFRNRITDATYYNTKVNSENDYIDASQAGGVLVFSSSYNKTGWNKMALTFNYSVADDFENQWVAKGNSNNPTFTMHPNNNKIKYNQSNGQSFESITEGKNKKFSFGFSTKYNNDLYLGISINTHDLYFSQRTKLLENNHNGAGGTLDADFRQGLAVVGNGASLSLGIIGRPIKNLRLGLAYHSPTWYNLSEEYIKENSTIFINDVTTETIKSGVSTYDYKLKTPSKLTGSIAYVFGKSGLISLDYTHKNYRKIKYQSGDFTNENQRFYDDLKSVGELRIGTEWNVKHFSFRGGYHYEASPYKEAKSSDALTGFSLGAGYKFRGGKFDLAYQRSTYTAPYNFYPEFKDLSSSELEHKTGMVTATLTLSM